MTKTSITTGDPFIDVGGLVLEAIQERFPQKSTPEIFEFVTDIYIDKWKQKLHSIFHTNSKILNPSTRGKHRSNTLEYLNYLFSNSRIEGCIDGFCRTCGKESILYPNSREFLPISGSGAFVNFHHAHEIGSFLCNECSLKLYFVPLGVIQLGGQAGLLWLQTEEVRRVWRKTIIQENLNKIARNTSEGILKSEYRNPRNALFNLAGNVIQEIHDDEHSEFIQLICFTNFGASPNCEIFVLPHPVFKFLNKILIPFGKYWYSLVNRYFFIKGVKWDRDESAWVKEKKKEKIVLGEAEYLNNRNMIYEKLLNNKSILRELLRVYRERFEYEMTPFPIAIAIHYAKEVLNMEKKQIQLIARISDVIFEMCRKENNFKRYLHLLEAPQKAYEFRGNLIRLIKVNFKNGNAEPLVRFQEYVELLLSDGRFWGEVRDLMLIYLYEKMHDEGVNRDAIPETEVTVAED